LELTLAALRQAFAEQKYICGDDVIVPVYLALKMGKPLLIEGAPGVGKTEIAKVLAAIFSTELIRLQCYEGLDETKALYEWNYQRQLIKIQLSRQEERPHLETDLFSLEYLLERPLLKAIMAEKRPVLLIDEVDKTDEEFEAFLFELLSDFQVSIPELGTIKARNIPIVVLTSNRDRELSEGLRRRCIFLHLDFPDPANEVEILRLKVPGLPEKLGQEIARVVAMLRNNSNLKKKPSIAESIDWARALMELGRDRLDPEIFKITANLLLKNRDDLEHFHQEKNVIDLFARVKLEPTPV
jgi:MoxR-like ATPase